MMGIDNTELMLLGLGIGFAVVLLVVTGWIRIYTDLEDALVSAGTPLMAVGTLVLWQVSESWLWRAFMFVIVATVALMLLQVLWNAKTLTGSWLKAFLLLPLKLAVATVVAIFLWNLFNGKDKE